jgi:hypothetical protein
MRNRTQLEVAIGIDLGPRLSFLALADVANVRFESMRSQVPGASFPSREPPREGSALVTSLHRTSLWMRNPSLGILSAYDEKLRPLGYEKLVAESVYLLQPSAHDCSLGSPSGNQTQILSSRPPCPAKGINLQSVADGECYATKISQELEIPADCVQRRLTGRFICNKVYLVSRD